MTWSSRRSSKRNGKPKSAKITRATIRSILRCCSVEDWNSFLLLKRSETKVSGGRCEKDCEVKKFSALLNKTTLPVGSLWDSHLRMEKDNRSLEGVSRRKLELEIHCFWPSDERVKGGSSKKKVEKTQLLQLSVYPYSTSFSSYCPILQLVKVAHHDIVWFNRGQRAISPAQLHSSWDDSSLIYSLLFSWSWGQRMRYIAERKIHMITLIYSS